MLTRFLLFMSQPGSQEAQESDQGNNEYFINYKRETWFTRHQKFAFAHLAYN